MTRQARAIIVDQYREDAPWEPERFTTYDFTPTLRLLGEGIKLAAKVNDNRDATPTEQVLAHVIIEIGKALAMQERQP